YRTLRRCVLSAFTMNSFRNIPSPYATFPRLHTSHAVIPSPAHEKGASIGDCQKQFWNSPLQSAHFTTETDLCLSTWWVKKDAARHSASVSAPHLDTSEASEAAGAAPTCAASGNGAVRPPEPPAAAKDTACMAANGPGRPRHRYGENWTISPLPGDW